MGQGSNQGLPRGLSDQRTGGQMPRGPVSCGALTGGLILFLYYRKLKVICEAHKKEEKID